MTDPLAAPRAITVAARYPRRPAGLPGQIDDLWRAAAPSNAARRLSSAQALLDGPDERLTAE